MNPKTLLIDPHGGYQKLKSYQTTEIIYDATVVFCNRFINIRSRTHDQMVQAARSGKQNIAEGSPEVAANTLNCLIHQANFLLDQQLRQLEQQFLKEGGFTEKLYKAKL